MSVRSPTRKGARASRARPREAGGTPALLALPGLTASRRGHDDLSRHRRLMHHPIERVHALVVERHYQSNTTKSRLPYDRICRTTAWPDGSSSVAYAEFPSIVRTNFGRACVTTPVWCHLSLW